MCLCFQVLGGSVINRPEISIKMTRPERGREGRDNERVGVGQRIGQNYTTHSNEIKYS